MNKALIYLNRMKELDDKAKKDLSSITNSEIEEREVLPNTILLTCSHVDVNNNPALHKEGEIYRCQICRKTNYNPALFFEEHKDKLLLQMKTNGAKEFEQSVLIELIQEIQKAKNHSHSLCNHLDKEGKEYRHYVANLIETCQICFETKRRSLL